MLKQFPHLLGPHVSKYDDLTHEETQWIQVQLAIDNGYRRCPHCQHDGFGPHCEECGQAFGGLGTKEAKGECRTCSSGGVLSIITGRYCRQCGSPAEETEFWTMLQESEKWPRERWKQLYAKLNEQTRDTVDEDERREIENYRGGAHWDKTGAPLRPHG